MALGFLSIESTSIFQDFDDSDEESDREEEEEDTEELHESEEDGLGFCLDLALVVAFF